ncbi:hypothetical protein D3C87_1538270 [compost metagenome]
MLLNPGHGWPGQGFLAFLTNLEAQSAQALGLLFRGSQAGGNGIPAFHLGGGAALADAVVLLRRDPTGQGVTPAQLGFIGTHAGDQHQLGQPRFHLLFALACAFSRLERRAV